MRNPYALPLRLRRDRLGELRQEIAETHERLAAALAGDAALVSQTSSERRLRSLAPDLNGDPWFAWQRQTRHHFACDIAGSQQRLEELRADMRDELGQISALEQAEQRLLAEARRKVARRAQAAADDRAATLCLAGTTI